MYRKCREKGLIMERDIIDPLQNAIDSIVARYNGR